MLAISRPGIHPRAVRDRRIEYAFSTRLQRRPPTTRCHSSGAAASTYDRLSPRSVFLSTLDDHLGELAHHFGRSSKAGKRRYLDRAANRRDTGRS